MRLRQPAAGFCRGLEVVSARPVGSDGKHLKLAVRDPRTRTAMDAIVFRLGEWYGNLPSRVDPGVRGADQ